MKVFAVSGVKNSGKTTLICKLLPIFKEREIRTAVIKHDGHEFSADVPGTDTCRQLQAGACGTVVFSESKLLMSRQQEKVSDGELISLLPMADLVLLEGFKQSSYPKLEIIRKGNSNQSVCKGHELRALVTDYTEEELTEQDRELLSGEKSISILGLEQADRIADLILAEAEEYPAKDEEDLGVQLKVMLTRNGRSFGPGIFRILKQIEVSGSIRAATDELQMSYSKCWKLINKAEDQFGFKLVERVNGGRNGGSSRLTEQAVRLIERYHAYVDQMEQISQLLFDQYFSEFK